MKSDNVSEYLALRGVLAQEKKNLEARLRRINEALGEPVVLEATRSDQPRGRGRPPGGSGAISLRQAVTQVTRHRALTKSEILAEVQKIGYRFTTDNPINSLGTILYGRNPRFRNEGGRFSLIPTSTGGSGENASAQAPEPSAPAGAFQRRRRQMSPEAKERIAAAQRARRAAAQPTEAAS